MPSGALKRLSSPDQIRLLADYDKVKAVRRGIIKIEEMKENLFFEIEESRWLHRLNGGDVRVRMFKKSTDYAYLFDEKTDTYLTCLERTIEIAGDAASMKERDKKRILGHSQRLKGYESYRRAKVKEALHYIDESDKDEPVFPSDLKQGIVIVTETGKRSRVTTEDQPTPGQNKKSNKSQKKPKRKLTVMTRKPVKNDRELSVLKKSGSKSKN